MQTLSMSFIGYFPDTLNDASHQLYSFREKITTSSLAQPSFNVKTSFLNIINIFEIWI